ncbi:MAG: hypothetical protein HQK51_05775 [Oligoflexia bacterium]|nr:hypothetical protein [Oligoflexia bacterium]
MYKKNQLLTSTFLFLATIFIITIFTISTIITTTTHAGNSNLISKIAKPEENSPYLNDPLIKKNITSIEQGVVLTFANVSDVSNVNDNSNSSSAAFPSFSFSSISKIFKNNHNEKAEKQQKIIFFVSGLHKNSCTRALPLMNKYEDYQKHIGIISESSYDINNKMIILSFEFKLLPFQLMLQLQLDRITKGGNYPYILKGGIFPDLSGVINVSNYKNRCLLVVTAFWQGPKSNIPNFILEIFLETVAKMSIEKLLRISVP